MKKLLLILPILFVVGCRSTSTYIKHSDVAIVSGDILYICNKGHGPMIYNYWKNDVYCDSTIKSVYLLDSIPFNALSKKSIPCGCNQRGYAKLK